MPTIRFKHPARHSREHPQPAAAWQVGEILTVQIASVNADGSYSAETIETYPSDLKGRHRKELEDLVAAHVAEMAGLQERHQAELEAARSAAVPPGPAD